MELHNSFTVPASIDEAWAILMDVQRVAGCMPGATLDRFDGDTFDGSVRVKLGAIQMTYRGGARFIERDSKAFRAQFEASGKERHGAGTAGATVTCQLREGGGTTEIEVGTDLSLTGKPAQFGRGAIEDITGKILRQFAANLATEMSGVEPTTSTASAAAQLDQLPPPDHHARPCRVEGARRSIAPPVDLMTMVDPAIRRRITLGLSAALAIFLTTWLLRRSRALS
jgi:carbon monoxide dehydrogenase subunit G